MNNEIEYLTPQNTKILRGKFNTMNVLYKRNLYKGVFAVSCFPVREPYKFISLFYQNENGEIEEIGIIKDIKDFSDEERKILIETLNKHYFSFIITKINDIKWRFGFLLFDVETDKGKREFYLKWERSRAIDYGERGKILIDVFEDRYIVPDIEKLSLFEKNLFTKFIYW